MENLERGKRVQNRDDVMHSQDFVVFNYFQPVRQNMFYLCYADNICARHNWSIRVCCPF